MPQDLIKVKQYQGVYYLKSKKKRFSGKPDRCFYIMYRNNVGRFIREKIGWVSEGYNAQLAVHVRGERMRKIRHGTDIPDKRKRELTFGEAWKRYDKWLDTGKKHVYDDRNRYKNHLKPKFENKALSQITTHDLEKFKDALLKKGLAPQTVKHILVIVRQVYNKMITWGLWSGQNPLKGLKMPKINNKRVRFLTYLESKALLNELQKISPQVYEISLLSLHTGMRANEVFSLLWGHLDFENNIIHVADPKGRPSRDVVMTKNVKNLFFKKMRGQPGELIFKTRSGGKIKQISRTLLRTVRELGFNDGIVDRRQLVSFHTLRHTFASWLAIQGTPILEIKELLGHATLAMTERYAHLIPDQKRKSVARMEKTFIEATTHKKDEPDQ